jgi:hypothetical protein
MQLDINWLHKERKEGRRSGRTTEMLANAVGVALVADKDTDIHIICGFGNEMTMWHSFIEVLRAISPTTTYFRNIHKNRPCITIPIGEILVRVMFGNESPSKAWRHEDESEKPVDEVWLFDHFWEETEILRGEAMRYRPKEFISEITPHFSSRGGSYW